MKTLKLITVKSRISPRGLIKFSASGGGGGLFEGGEGAYSRGGLIKFFGKKFKDMSK